VQDGQVFAQMHYAGRPVQCRQYAMADVCAELAKQADATLTRAEPEPEPAGVEG
jgi:hypothetical protein